MEVAKVIGSLWATKKDAKLNGQKLLVLKIMESQTSMKSGFVIAADIVGAGKGELVLLSRGSAARNAVGRPDCPIDAAVVAIVDTIEIAENE